FRVPRAGADQVDLHWHGAPPGTEGLVRDARLILTRRRGDAEKEAENATGKSEPKSAETAEIPGLRAEVAEKEEGVVRAALGWTGRRPILLMSRPPLESRGRRVAANRRPDGLRFRRLAPPRLRLRLGLPVCRRERLRWAARARDLEPPWRRRRWETGNRR